MKPTTLVACLFLLSGSLVGQSAPCAALNDQNTAVSPNVTAFGFAGPNTWAWQFTPTTALVVFGMQIYAGNTSLPGFMTLEVWGEDPVSQLPLGRLAYGTWRISAGLGNAWQGANLSAITVLQPSTPYWLVWIEPGFSTVPTEPGGSSVPATRLSGANWVALPPASPKIRLFCAPLQGPNVLSNGVPCGGSGGSLGTFFTNQAPTVGNADFALEGSGFPSGSIAVMVLGLTPNWMSVPVPGLPPGCMQHTDVLVAVFGTTGTGNVRASSAFGHAIFPVPVPPNGALTGFYLGAQMAAHDTGFLTPLPFVTSNGLRITLL